MLRKYETLFILRPDLTDEEFDRIKTRIKDIIKGKAGLEIVYQDWGKKRLAYPIRKYPKGNYVYVRYLGDTSTVTEIEYFMKVSDEVVRFLTTKLADRVDPEVFDIDEDRIGIYPFNVKPRELSRDDDDDGDGNGDFRGDDEDRPFRPRKVQSTPEEPNEDGAEPQSKAKDEPAAEESIEAEPEKVKPEEMESEEEASKEEASKEEASKEEASEEEASKEEASKEEASEEEASKEEASEEEASKEEASKEEASKEEEEK